MRWRRIGEDSLAVLSGTWKVKGQKTSVYRRITESDESEAVRVFPKSRHRAKERSGCTSKCVGGYDGAIMLGSALEFQVHDGRKY